MPFKVKFDLSDYKSILPNDDEKEEYLKNDYVINDDAYFADDFDNCIWKKYKPTKEDIASPIYREQEARRILKTGVWIVIKDQVVWLPPSYYFALQYGKVGDDDLQFRLKRLKHVYFKLMARKNPRCFGTLTIKNRADGETTMAIIDAFWECLDGNMNAGNIGIQSKTNSDAINPCWSTLQLLWQSIPQWVKAMVCSDFASGDNIAQKMKFMRDGDEQNGITARNITVQYYPAVFNAMDGKHNMKKCILDEICKWSEAEFYATFNNYSKFIMPGLERRGIFDMFSSPADKPCKSNEQVFSLWKDSNPDELDETGCTKSGIFRYYSNPLEGIQGAYDKWGDADPDIIYAEIMRRRNAKPKEELLGEVRGFPLNESEMFESSEGGKFWDNHAGIEARKIYLMGTRFKDTKTQEPTVVYGNMEWQDGIKDGIPVFRMSDKTAFDVYDARFCFAWLPKNMPELRRNSEGLYVPPDYVENCVGIDSVDKRYANKRASNFAMVNTKFRDIQETGIVKCPTMIYCNRPLPIEISYEDAIKFCIFNQSLAQVESLNTKIVDYFEDRGYLDWMISKIGMPRNSLQKGDAPSGGKSAFMDEIIGLLNAATNIPYDKSIKPPLENIWFYELLEDITKFNRDDTHSNDLAMAWGQSLLGMAKLTFKKTRKPDAKVGEALRFQLQ